MCVRFTDKKDLNFLTVAEESSMNVLQKRIQREENARKNNELKLKKIIHKTINLY